MVDRVDQSVQLTIHEFRLNLLQKKKIIITNNIKYVKILKR